MPADRLGAPVGDAEPLPARTDGLVSVGQRIGQSVLDEREPGQLCDQPPKLGHEPGPGVMGH